jgi:radical SAM superfamily enzyme YgiQ (UPF0313 family)
MKIMLVNASALSLENRPWHEARRRHAYAPTTLTTLAALVPPELAAEVFLVDETVDRVPDGFNNADLVGISAMTCDVVRAYELADSARKQGITVVLGGYHVSFMVSEALAHADSVVVGFAEESWPRLLRDYAQGRLQPRYEFPWEQHFAKTFPVPRRDLLKRKRYLIPDSLESSRGCPNACRFCVIPSMHRRSCSTRSAESLRNDIDTIGGRRFAFLDSNPFEDAAHGDMLFSLLSSYRCEWYAASSLKCITSEAWVRSAAKSGCKGLLIGFESLNQSSLVGEGKGFNKVDRYVSTIRLLHDNGIAVLGCFVFGFDQDDASVFERTVEFVDRSGIDLVLYSIYTPFPGSPALTSLEAEGRILHRDWRRYDGRHTTFLPARMSADQLQQGLFYAWSKTYGLPSIIRRIAGVSPAPLFSLFGNLAFRFYRKTFLPESTRS